MLTRDQILALDDLTRAEVEVPEWGGSVFVRTLTGAEWAQVSTNPELRGIDLVVMATVDKDGKPMFTKEDAEALEGKHFLALERIARAVLKMNALAAENIEAAGND